MSAMLFASIFPRAQRASTYDISAERNVWLQSALRSFAIFCDYMETGLSAIVCDLRSAIVYDPRSSAIRDRLRSFAIIWKPALKDSTHVFTQEGNQCGLSLLAFSYLDPLIYRSIDPLIYRSTDLQIHRSTDPSVHWSISAPIYRPIDPLIYWSIDPSIHWSSDLLMMHHGTTHESTHRST